MSASAAGSTARWGEFQDCGSVGIGGMRQMRTVQFHHMRVPKPRAAAPPVEVAKRTEVLAKVRSWPIHALELGESIERVVDVVGPKESRAWQVSATTCRSQRPESIERTRSTSGRGTEQTSSSVPVDV